MILYDYSIVNTIILIGTIFSCVYALSTIIYIIVINYKWRKKILAIDHEFKVGDIVYYKDAPFEVVKVNKYTIIIKHGFESVINKDEVTWK